MDIFAFIFIGFTIFVLCSLCGFCCKNRDEGAIFSTPVVITSQTHQPVGSAYPVSVQTMTGPGVIQTSYQTTVPSQNVQMPMPFNSSASPYPQGQYPTGGQHPPYPTSQTAPYPSQMPYPQQGYQGQSNAPYPTTQSAAPYPTASHLPMMDPPAYNEVVGNESYQKQAPYNPNYNA